MSQVEPKFGDCVDCVFYRKLFPRKICFDCDVGEFFEFRVDDEMPSDTELMKIYSRMERDDN